MHRKSIVSVVNISQLKQKIQAKNRYTQPWLYINHQVLWLIFHASIFVLLQLLLYYCPSVIERYVHMLYDV